MSPIDVVTAFIGEWSKSHDALIQAHHTYFTPQTIWENVGWSTTVGVDEALAFVRKFEEQTGLATMEVDMLAISATGNKVLTERVDRLLDGSGKVLVSMRLMGIFEVEDGKIVKWRDYFDTAALGSLAN